MSIALEVKKSEENESARGDKRRSFFAPTVCKLNSIFRRRNRRNLIQCRRHAD